MSKVCATDIYSLRIAYGVSSYAIFVLSSDTTFNICTFEKMERLEIIKGLQTRAARDILFFKPELEREENPDQATNILQQIQEAEQQLLNLQREEADIHRHRLNNLRAALSDFRSGARKHNSKP